MRDGCGLKLWWCVVRGRKVGLEIVQDRIDLGRVEARQRQVKTFLLQQRSKLCELCCQDGAIPAGVLRQLVVGNREQALLRIPQADCLDRRHHLEAQQLGGGEPAVAGKDYIVLIDHDRLEVASALDALRNPLHLALRPPAGVTRVRLERARGSHLDLWDWSRVKSPMDGFHLSV